MKRTAGRPLFALAILLAVYLCAPFVASVPQIGHADWAGVDWRATWSAVGVSAASASVAALVILVGGVPLGYWLARSSSRGMAPFWERREVFMPASTAISATSAPREG